LADKNQTDGEFFAVVGKGRQGVESMLEKMGGEIQKIAAPNVGGNFETWKTRALVEISNRDELKTVLQSREGIFSVYKALSKAATMGLQIGGQFPHAYLVPMGGKAQLVVTAEGYAFASAHGPGAVLANVPKLVRVHEKDTLRIDETAGTVRHEFDAFGDRGKLVGYYMRLEYRDGHTEVSNITRAEVEGVAKAYSQKNGPAWSKSPEAMNDKIAAKQLLKKPVREAEGLAMLMSLDEYEAPEYSPPPRDIAERMADRLDDSMRTVEPEPVSEEAEPEPEHDPDEPKPIF
jgi:recombinational DNA repair protein RecT